MIVSNKEDSFILDNKEHTTRWVVKLSNGENIYYDDYRPDLEEHSSWLRLKKYCEINNFYIVSMYLQFRSHYENLESDKQGYYFSKVIKGSVHRVSHYFLVGYLENETVHITKYSVPSLLVQEKFTRTKEECKDCLIWQKNE